MKIFYEQLYRIFADCEIGFNKSGLFLSINNKKSSQFAKKINIKLEILIYLRVFL